MLDAAELETNLLDFRRKAFGFERIAAVDGEEFAVFSRRETESESKLRPKLVRLFVVVPRATLVHDLASDLLLIAPDGAVPGPRSTGEAQEADAEPAEFREQGLEWRRLGVAEGTAYVPKNRAASLGGAPALAALGLGDRAP